MSAEPSKEAVEASLELITVNAALLRLFKGEYRDSGDRHSDALYVQGHIEVMSSAIAPLRARVERLERQIEDKTAEAKNAENVWVSRITSLERQLAEARELLREIRDNEVNASDEADKLLRDHQPSELSKLRTAAKAAEEALERINKWHGEFPASGRFWDEPKNEWQMSYGAPFGSNGERDYMRNIAAAALATLRLSLGKKEGTT